MMKAVSVKNLSYQYQAEGAPILKKLSFDIIRGEIVALMGLSGCGKSTLCYCLSGIIPHYWSGIMEGDVLVNGINTQDSRVASLAREIGMVFQDPDTQLFLPTVEDELAFAPENLCLPVEEVEARVGNVLTILGINDLRYANPKNLSGGQKQLVALGAVLSLDPGILVLDEVMAPLDPASKKRISDAVNALRQRGKTVLVVEHDLEAVSFADRILVLENGRLIKDGQAPDVLGEREFLLRHKLELEDELRIKRWDL